MVCIILYSVLQTNKKGFKSIWREALVEMFLYMQEAGKENLKAKKAWETLAYVMQIPVNRRVVCVLHWHFARHSIWPSNLESRLKNEINAWDTVIITNLLVFRGQLTWYWLCTSLVYVWYCARAFFDYWPAAYC